MDLSPARRWMDRRFGGKEAFVPFKTFGPDPLESVVNVRLTTAEKEHLKEEANLAGLTVSALVRRRAFGRPIIASADAAMIRELRRLGGLLKSIYTSSHKAYAAETAAALTEVKKYIKKLSDDS
jgi:hypothetical protein